MGDGMWCLAVATQIYLEAIAFDPSGFSHMYVPLTAPFYSHVYSDSFACRFTWVNPATN